MKRRIGTITLTRAKSVNQDVGITPGNYQTIEVEPQTVELYADLQWSLGSISWSFPGTAVYSRYMNRIGASSRLQEDSERQSASWHRHMYLYDLHAVICNDDYIVELDPNVEHTVEAKILGEPGRKHLAVYSRVTFTDS